MKKVDVNATSIAICRLAGAEFTEEELADFAKVEAGEMTREELIQKQKDRLARLREKEPTKFDTDN